MRKTFQAIGCIMLTVGMTGTLGIAGTLIGLFVTYVTFKDDKVKA